MSLPIQVRGLKADVQQLSAVPISIYGYRIYNPNNYTVYVKLYNKLASNVTVTGSGSDTPLLTITAAALTDTANDISQAFNVALSIRCTTRNIDNDTTPPADPPDVVLSITAAGSGTGDALVALPLSQFAATTSAQLAGVITNETGTGALVFGTSPALTTAVLTSPTLVTPALGIPTSGTLTSCTGLPVSGIAQASDLITLAPADAAPTLDDIMLTYDQASDQLKQVTLSNLASNLEIDTIQDTVSGFQAQFDTTGLTTNRTIRIADGNSVTVIPTATRPAGKVFTSLTVGGVMSYGYPDVSTESQFTSNQNNYTPASAAYYLRMSTDGTRNLSGVVGSGTGGETHVIFCVANTLVLTHQDTNSTASNRFSNSTGADITLTAGQAALLTYDSVASRWLVSGLSGGGGGTPGGSTTQIQYNNAGAFGGTTPLTYNGTAIAQLVGSSYLWADPTDSSKHVIMDLSNLTAFATRTFRAPDANFTGVVGGTGTTHQFVTAISTAGVISRAQPALDDITAFTSAQLATQITDETGSGAAVFATSPTLVTPALGTPSALVLTNASGTVTNLTLVTPALGTPASGTLTNCTIPDSATFTHDLTAIPNATGGWNEYFVTGSDFTTTNLTATAITGLTTGTLSNAIWYEFEVVLRLLNAADTAGLKWGITGNGTGTASQVFCTYMVNSNGAAAGAAAALNGVATLSTAILNYSGGEGILAGKGFFLSRSTGTATMEIDIAKVTSNTATVRVASLLRIRKAHT